MKYSNSYIGLLLVVLLVGCKDDIVDGQWIPPISSSPNVLLIIADDMSIDASPGYSIGATKPNMPNLQKMIDNGVTFDNFWTYPICSPTRASMLTGRYGYRTGVLNVDDAGTIPADEKTLHAHIGALGNDYSHSIIGKWHLSKKEPQRPTQMGVGYYAGLLGGAVSDYNSWSFTENGQTNTSDEYVTTKFTNLAIDWINEQDKPWFCWLAYTAPHTPFHLPPDSMHSQGNLPTDQASIDANPLPYFMAMMESLDFEIGRLLDQIPANELENTVIIFIGDNGSHGQVIQAPYVSTQAKGSLYEGGIHTPLIVSGTGVTRMNERESALVGSVDLFATIAELCGDTKTTYEDSYSIAGLLDNSRATDRAYNYSEVLNTNANKSGYTIRNKSYKLIEFDSGNRRLYNLEKDPYELENLINKMSTADQTALTDLMAEAASIRQ
ncbi:MAG: arylsulfatase A-like enzyme [Bacteroidia bacterium]|jgi:arylsulfatase A-like enzyme